MTTRPSSPPPPPLPSRASGVQLRLESVAVGFGSRRVLTGVSLTVAAGQRVGVVGENGSGKTTLLRVAAGLLVPDDGTVVATGDGGPAPRVGLLHQQVPFAAQATVGQAVESALRPARDAVAAVDAAARHLARHPADAQAADRYAAALATAERLDAWHPQARAATMLAGLGLGDVEADRPVATLSGGQLARLALAWLLLDAPDVLLLDEPTNHLDDAAASHLHGVLTRWRGPVLLASHDRAFLDETVTELVDLDPVALPHEVAGPLLGDGEGTGIGLTRFTGTYTAYLDARLDAADRWARRYRDEQAELRRLRGVVRREHSVGHPGREPRSEMRGSRKFYSDRNAAVVSRRVDDARDRLAALEASQVRRPPAALWFRGLTAAAPEPSRRWSGPVLEAMQVEVADRLPATSLTVSAGETWLVTGPNGSGKSTLLAVLAGDLAPTAGAVSTPHALRVGLLSQETELPDPAGRGPGRTAAQAYRDLAGAAADRVPLATFGLLAPRDETTAVDALSVGQRRRLALAVLLAEPPDVLLLDEPSARTGSNLDRHEHTREVPWDLAGPGGSDSRGSCVARGRRGRIRTSARLCLCRSGAMSRLGW